MKPGRNTSGNRILFEQKWLKKSTQMSIILGIVTLVLLGGAVVFFTMPTKQTQAIVAIVLGILSALWGFFEFKGRHDRTVYSTDKIEEFRGDQLLKTLPFDDGLKVSSGRRLNSNYMELTAKGSNGVSILLATTKKPGSESSEYEPSPEVLASIRDHLFKVVENEIRTKLSKNETFEVESTWKISPTGVTLFDDHIPWQSLNINCNDSTGVITFSNHSKQVGLRMLTEQNAVPAAEVCIERAAVGGWS